MSSPSRYKSLRGRIAHFVAPRRTSILECLAQHFGVPAEKAQELLSLGAIYSNKRRVFTDRILEKGAYLRIHLQPKRFPVAGIDWRRMLVYQSPQFAVINKPPGVPVHATLDNASDNLLHQMRLFSGHHYLVTQRLDVPVSGLMVLARTPEFQRRFNTWLGERKVKKRYRALVETAPPLGLQTHYMEDTERAPKTLSSQQVTGWLRCELTVHRADAVVWSGLSLFDVEVELHTGRTHQIRGQLAAMGSPILGDRVYGSRRNGPSPESIGLFSARLEWPNPGAAPYIFEATPSWQVQISPEEKSLQ